MKLTPDIFETYWPLTDVVLGERLGTPTSPRPVGIIHAKEGDYVFKVADQRSDWRHALEALDYLPAHGFTQVPRLLKTKQCETYQSLGDDRICIMEFVDGNTPSHNAEPCAKLGRLMASLHIVEGYPYSATFIPSEVIEDELPTLVVDKPFQDEYLKLVESLPSFEDLPQAVIHTDLSFGNVIERADGELVMIDFDDIGIGARVIDLAYPLILSFVTSDCVYREDNARAFFSAYRSQIELSDHEVELIFPGALFFALMYVIYGDIDSNWRRIQWAVANRSLLEKSFQ
jgi:Ser/Thr protein kinase RdoA (MazF antagonist)